MANESIPPAAEMEKPRTPREWYNEGTRKLQDRKLREAEAALQTAAASLDEAVQQTALFNLGHVRFRQGAEILKEAPNGDTARARGSAATGQGDQAIRVADAALAGDNLQALVAAYMLGRGAQKDLKAAAAAVKRALDAHSAVLLRWQRASGDFKSALELRPTDADAPFNADVVDRRIAELVDRQQLMQMMAQRVGDKRQELRGKMAELKKRLPQDMRDKMGDEDEDDEDTEPKQPPNGQKEMPSKEGREMEVTPEDALRLLEVLKLDANRKLPMGLDQSEPPKNRRGRDW